MTIIIVKNSLAVKRGNWSKEEDEINENIPGESSIQCKDRWTKILQSPFKRRWTAEEDQKLLKWVETNGACKWPECAQFIKGRSGMQCRQRWLSSLNSDLKKGEWSKEEHELLLRLFNEYGPLWSKIAKFLPGRSGQQCAQKGYWDLKKGNWSKEEDKKMLETEKVDNEETSLDDMDQNSECNYEPFPSNHQSSANVSEHCEAQNTGKWTLEEKQLLQKFVSFFGENHWRKISENIPGRSYIQCRNCWKNISQNIPDCDSIQRSLESRSPSRHWTSTEDQKKQASTLNDNKIGVERDTMVVEKDTLFSDGDQNLESKNHKSPTLDKELSPNTSEDSEAQETDEWTSQEDGLLYKLFYLFGENQWQIISQNISGRSPVQCLIRWTKTLEPRLARRHWTSIEDKKNRASAMDGKKKISVETHKVDERKFEKRVNRLMSEEIYDTDDSDAVFEDVLGALNYSLKNDLLTKEFDLSLSNVEDISQLEDLQRKVLSYCQSNITHLCETFKKIEPDNASQSEGRGNVQPETGEKGPSAQAFPESPKGESEKAGEKVVKGNERIMETEEVEDRAGVQMYLLETQENKMDGFTDADQKLTFLFRHLYSLETLLSKTKKYLAQFESSLRPRKGVRPGNIKRTKEDNSEFDRVVKKKKTV